MTFNEQLTHLQRPEDRPEHKQKYTGLTKAHGNQLSGSLLCDTIVSLGLTPYQWEEH